jgi:hypothetical protein
MRRLLLSLSAAALVCGFIATPSASAQQQTVNFFIGGFVPRSLDARASGDTILADSTDVVNGVDFSLATFNRNHGIDISKFNGVTVGGEWLFRVNPYVEGGLGLGYYERQVPTSYANFVNPDGSEIAQDLRLRTVPFTATFRLLPLGRSPVQPYIGAGVGVYAWRYSETGDFIDDSDLSVFNENIVGSGGAVGPIVLFGIRFAAGPVVPGFEARYQSATANLPADQDFVGTKIDLGGWNALFTLGVRF